MSEGKERKVNEKERQTKRTIKPLLRQILWLKCYNKQK